MNARPDNDNFIELRKALVTVRTVAEAASALLKANRGSEVDRAEMIALFDLLFDVACDAERGWIPEDARQS